MKWQEYQTKYNDKTDMLKTGLVDHARFSNLID